eukprot:2453043-Rhodomonas_salina.1
MLLLPLYDSFPSEPGTVACRLSLADGVDGGGLLGEDNGAAHSAGGSDGAVLDGQGAIEQDEFARDALLLLLLRYCYVSMPMCGKQCAWAAGCQVHTRERVQSGRADLRKLWAVLQSRQHLYATLLLSKSSTLSHGQRRLRTLCIDH